MINTSYASENDYANNYVMTCKRPSTFHAYCTHPELLGEVLANVHEPDRQHLFHACEQRDRHPLE